MALPQAAGSIKLWPPTGTNYRRQMLCRRHRKAATARPWCPPKQHLLLPLPGRLYFSSLPQARIDDKAHRHYQNAPGDAALKPATSPGSAALLAEKFLK